MPKTAIKIGPEDHGRRMTLDEFDLAEVQEGRLYELSRGEVIVSDVPKPQHLAVVSAIRLQLASYQLAYPDRIHCVASGSECKILIHELESERHPDLAVYKNPPPEDEDVWSIWIPEIVIEIVSPGSEDRDYVEKREEYLLFGVSEYWIVDPARNEVLILQRWRGAWKERTIRPPELYQTRLLPGLEFDSGPLFEEM